MAKYLGETLIEEKNYPDFLIGKDNQVMYFIECYGQYDGGHHKQWTLDQIARIVKGTPIIVKLAKWDDGTENYRVSTGEPSNEYLEWAKEMLGEYNEDDEEYEYGYDEGIAP
jgi:hypothetical protein